ncbi:MAG: hypothetical protein WCG47_18680 [Dermatophilaceae bacterium]
MNTQAQPPDSSGEAITYDDIITLTAWMAQHGYTADEIAYAVEKPWKHIDLITRAKLGAQPPDE